MVTPLNARLFQLMRADPHKLDFSSDLLAHLPGAGGLGPMGPMGEAMPPTHDLTRPPSLFSAAGACQNISVFSEQLRACVCACAPVCVCVSEFSVFWTN